MPDPGRSDDFDRFGFVRNNPITYIDPTGHVTSKCLFAGDSDFTGSTLYGVHFQEEWTFENIMAAMDGVEKVGETLRKHLGGTSSEAFRKAYGTSPRKPMVFEWDPDCPECRPKDCGDDFTSDRCKPKFGFTAGPRHIKFASLSQRSHLRRVNNVVHELGHAFENVIIQLDASGKDFKPARSSLPSYLSTTREGLAEGGDWQQSEELTSGEIFADMWIGWMYDGKWAVLPDGRMTEMGLARSDWMLLNMPYFISLIP